VLTNAKQTEVTATNSLKLDRRWIGHALVPVSPVMVVGARTALSGINIVPIGHNIVITQEYWGHG